MKHRWLIRLLLIAILAVLVTWLEPTRVVWGWLRGESFYEGRPTSYWAEQIRPWQLCDNPGVTEFAHFINPSPGTDAQRSFDGRPQVSRIIRIEPREGNVRKWIKRWVSLPELRWPKVLDGDPEAIDVLNELVEHVEPGICDWARRGLERMHTHERGPLVTVTGEPGELLSIELEAARKAANAKP